MKSWNKTKEMRCPEDCGPEQCQLWIGGTAILLLLLVVAVVLLLLVPL
jgi:hypothetical protein